MPTNPPSSRTRSAILLLALLLVVPARLGAETFVWVDEQGVTHLSDDATAAPEGARRSDGDDVDRLRALWGTDLTGPVPRTPPGSSSSREGRVLRLLAGAVHDLKRGERARATAALNSALRLAPRRPEPHWYLALLARERGRYQSAAEHLRDFLATAGPELASWRVSAEQRLEFLRDERRLADESLARAPLRLLRTESPHFRIQLDSELSQASAGYASRALNYLEGARESVSAQIGVEPLEPLGVVFYGKAAYARAHRHRFSFQTVGFFDGRIHVSSPAHPSGTLRPLLFHEYTHAVFRDHTGGDRPYWLNEGLAEQIERGARKHPASTRSERASLRAAITAGEWIPLRRLAPSFSGLSDARARSAYLEAVVVVEWISARTERAERARLLESIGEGLSADQALYGILGLDTDGIDQAVRESILAEFPAVEPAAQGTR